MLIHDHTELKQKTKTADGVANMTPVSAGSLSLGDRATYSKLELLSGDSFDTAYIKGLIKGNDSIVRDEKSEAAESAVPAVKALAARGAELDTKHAEKAKQLAQAATRSDACAGARGGSRSLPELDKGGALAAFAEWGLSDGGDVRVALEVFAQGAAKDAHASAVDDADARQASEKGLVDVAFDLAFGLVGGAANNV